MKGLVEIQTTYISTKDNKYWNGSRWQCGVCDEQCHSPDENYSNLPYILVEFWKDALGIGKDEVKRAIIRLEAKKFSCKKAILKLYSYGEWWGTSKIYLYEIPENVDLKTVTWNTRPEIGNLVGYAESHYPAHEGWMEWDITESINTWWERFNFPPTYYLLHEKEVLDQHGGKCLHFVSEKATENLPTCEFE